MIMVDAAAAAADYLQTTVVQYWDQCGDQLSENACLRPPHEATV